VIASSRGFGVGALPETASNAAFALAAALPVEDFAFVALVLVALTLVGFVSFLVFALTDVLTETFFFAFAASSFFALAFFAPAVVATALEEVFLTVAFFFRGGFFPTVGVLRLFVVFFAIGAFFAVSLVGDMGGIIIGLGWLDKG